MGQKLVVLWLEDDVILRSAFIRALKTCGDFVFLVASTVTEAMALLDASVDRIIIDVCLGVSCLS